MANALASNNEASQSNVYKSLRDLSLGDVEDSFKSSDERQIQIDRLGEDANKDENLLIEKPLDDVEDFKFPHVEDNVEDNADEDNENFGNNQSSLPLSDTSNSQSLSKSLKSSNRRESAGGGKPMTLKEQEETIDQAKRENWSLKLKIVLLENRLSEVAPDQINDALKENIQLKIDCQNMRMDLKRNRNIALKLEKAIENLNNENKKQKLIIDSHQRNNNNKSGLMSKEIEERIRNAEINEEEARTLLEMSSERERALEERIHLLESEIENNNNKSDNGWDNEEDSRAEISRLRDEVLAERDAKEDIIASRVEIENQLIESTEQVERLTIELNNGNDDNSFSDLDNGVSFGNGRRSRRKIIDLERENESLETQIQAQIQLIESRDHEIEELYAHVERLENHIENNTNSRRSIKQRNLSQSELEFELEKLDNECNILRDKLSEAHVLIERKESELDENDHKFNLLANEFERDRSIEKEELIECRQKINDYEMKMSEFEDQQEHMQQELEQYLEKIQVDLQERNDELLAANEEIRRISEQNIQLENELDVVCARFEALESDLLEMQQRLDQEQDIQEQVTYTLKEKIENLQYQKRELEKAMERQLSEQRQNREVSDDLALRLAEREEQSREEMERLRLIQDDYDKLTLSMKEEKDGRERDRIFYGRETRDLEMKHKRSIESKEEHVKALNVELTQIKSQLEARENDYKKLQTMISKIEDEHKELGHSHINDTAALELEIDRLSRDGERYERDITQLRKEQERKDKLMIEREKELNEANNENRELSLQLNSESQSNIYNNERIHSSQQQYQEALEEVTRLKDRLQESDSRLMREEKGLNQSESQYKQQITERNTLLLSVYQYMEKIIGVEKNRKNSDARPYNNFNAFHENLISKMKSISNIQLKFDKKSKDIENVWVEKFANLKKQVDSRWKQLERLEVSIKSASDLHKQWRLRANEKTRELDELKQSYNEIMIQLSNAKSKSLSPSIDSNTEVKSLTARASTAERRLNITQNQLNQAEEKLIEARNKIIESDNKWANRAKEFEARMKAAEEKVKRERQGAKDRVYDLEKNIDNLNKQIDGANKRNTTLQTLVRSSSQHSS